MLTGRNPGALGGMPAASLGQVVLKAMSEMPLSRGLCGETSSVSTAVALNHWSCGRNYEIITTEARRRGESRHGSILLLSPDCRADRIDYCYRQTTQQYQRPLGPTGMRAGLAWRLRAKSRGYQPAKLMTRLPLPPCHGRRRPATHDFVDTSTAIRGWLAVACPRAGRWPDPWARHDGERARHRSLCCDTNCHRLLLDRAAPA